MSTSGALKLPYTVGSPKDSGIISLSVFRFTNKGLAREMRPAWAVLGLTGLYFVHDASDRVLGAERTLGRLHIPRDINL